MEQRLSSFNSLYTFATAPTLTCSFHIQASYLPFTHLLSPFFFCLIWSFSTSPQCPETDFFCFPFVMCLLNTPVLFITESPRETSHGAHFKPRIVKLQSLSSVLGQIVSLWVHSHSGNRVTCSIWAFPVPTLASYTWRGKKSQLAFQGRVSSNMHLLSTSLVPATVLCRYVG